MSYSEEGYNAGRSPRASELLDVAICSLGAPLCCVWSRRATRAPGRPARSVQWSPWPVSHINS